MHSVHFSLLAGIICVSIGQLANFAKADFQDCTGILNGATCDQISNHDSPAYKMCCAPIGDTQQTAALVKLRPKIQSLRSSLLSCEKQEAGLSPNASPCQRRGCFCGLADSKIPQGCFSDGGDEVCCTSHTDPTISDLSVAQSEYRNLQNSLKDCQAKVKTLSAHTGSVESPTSHDSGLRSAPVADQPAR